MSAPLEQPIYAESFEEVEDNEPLLPNETVKERAKVSIRRRWLQPLRSRRLPPSEGIILSLKQFAKKYSSFFPLCVFIEQGYYDPKLHYEVSAGDFYTLNFLSTTRSIVVKDRGGNLNVFPTNSHVECTFLYNPDGDLERAKRGYILPTVRDILERRARPDVVMATHDYEGGSEEASVKESEVLVLTSKRTWSSANSLSVYSVTLGTPKLLASSCRGEFSTNPYSTKMRISDILGRVDKSFPVKACFYVAQEFEQEIEPSLVEEPLEVIGVRSTECVVANVSIHAPATESRPASSSPLVELPLHTSVIVSLHLHKDACCTRQRPRVVEKARDKSRGKSGAFHPPLAGERSAYQGLVETEVGSEPLYEYPAPRKLSSEISTAVTILEKSLKEVCKKISLCIPAARGSKCQGL